MKRVARCGGLALLFLAGLLPAQTALPLPRVLPRDLGFNGQKLEEGIDRLVREAIEEGETAGCVVLVGRDRAVALHRAWGVREERDGMRFAMIPDAVFDLASLTKPLATALSMMAVFERRWTTPQARVADQLSGFGVNGKEAITIDQLLRHRSGLLPDNHLRDYREGRAEAFRRIDALGLRAAPGEKFIYTDVGYLVLGRLVEKHSGESLDVFARKAVFEPLGLRSTGFLPVGAAIPPRVAQRLVPTEPARRGEAPLRGVVHDPRARLIGGVAGHAGLFSDADDLARIASTLLHEGVTPEGRRVFSRETVRSLSDPGDLPRGERRGRGFDVASRFSGPRGRHFPPNSFGHTGFTGTSMWLDPATRSFVIILTSRLYPDGKGDVRGLRREIGTLVGACLRDAPWPLRPEEAPPEPVFATNAIDNFTNFNQWPSALNRAKAGLITNHTGRDLMGQRTIDVFAERPPLRDGKATSGPELVRLFSPEHGLEGTFDEKVGHGRDEKTGLPVFSLYGETRKPTPEMLKGLEVLIFDIQDIGCRFYTYISTMKNAMEACAENGLALVVLDRPNVIGGDLVEGPVADDDALDFVGCHPIPVRHGMSVGELALLMKHELGLDLSLHVIECLWLRRFEFDRLQLDWINPSPNMRSVTAARLYPGIGLLETTNLSVGRGTATPFLHIGAPWMDGAALAQRLNARALPGIRFHETSFTPDASKFKGKTCRGIRFELTDPRAFRSLPTGIEVAVALRALHPKDWDPKRYPRLLKHKKTFDLLLAGATAAEIMATWQEDLEAFKHRRRRFLLYDR